MRDYVQEAAARHFICKLFGRVFAEEPDACLQELLSSDLTKHALRVVMSVSASDSDSEVKECDSLMFSVEDIASISNSEFTRLFVGPGALPAPPWESVYVSSKRSLFTHDTLKVRMFYKKCGYRIQSETNVPDDHIASELFFMAALAVEELEAREALDNERVDVLIDHQREFLDCHLLRWVDSFAACLAEYNPNSCYAHIASVLTGFLKAYRVSL